MNRTPLSFDQSLLTEVEVEIEFLADALSAGDSSAVDQILNVAFPTGDGTDKTLRFWTADDWRQAVLARYRIAAKITAAAASFDELAQRISPGHDTEAG